MATLSDLVAEMRRLGVTEASFHDGEPVRIVLGHEPAEPTAFAAPTDEELRAERERTLFGAARR